MLDRVILTFVHEAAFISWGAIYLHKELLICESKYVGDSRGLVVQAQARQQQQKGRRSRAPLVSGVVAKLPRRLAHKFDEVYHQALTYTLAAEFPLLGGEETGSAVRKITFWGTW